MAGPTGAPCRHRETAVMQNMLPGLQTVHRAVALACAGHAGPIKYPGRVCTSGTLTPRVPAYPDIARYPHLLSGRLASTAELCTGPPV